MGYAELRYPDMRTELLSVLESLSSEEYQRSVWIEGNRPDGITHDEFDYAVHFLFDDTSLSEDPNGSVGIFLRSEEEADSVKELINVLDVLFQRRGAGLTDLEYIDLPEWKSVTRAAQRALKVCLER